MRPIICLTVLAATLCQPLGAQEPTRETAKPSRFVPGEVWLDTSGKPIQAHSAGILVRGNTYYWYGEDRTLRQASVSCYSSTDLYNWKHEGVVFTREALPENLRNNTFIERPKVIFNDWWRVWNKYDPREYVPWLNDFLDEHYHRIDQMSLYIRKDVDIELLFESTAK